MDEKQRAEFLLAVTEAAARIGVKPGAVVVVAPGGDGMGSIAVPGLFQGWAPMADLLPPGAAALLGAFGGGKR